MLGMGFFQHIFKPHDEVKIKPLPGFSEGHRGIPRQCGDGNDGHPVGPASRSPIYRSLAAGIE
ncbi:MAG: hypothetical protein AMJ94_06655 [Deltaproteobacteria bacterium SM23_61]|nr:MAG: hypothetical protein AMJ94_06655 [Deltaproteobacteria bacterium SM23_61]